jgi:signal transduction histidine kinase
MIHLRLRAKIALWSVLAASLALAAGLGGIHLFLRVELMEMVDQRMDREARELLWDLDHQLGGPVENRETITEDLFSPALSSRLMEIYGRGGKLMFRSPNLRQSLAGPDLEAHNVRIHDRPYRVGTYYHKFLTLRIASPLRNYNEILNRVVWAIVVVLPGVALFSVLGGFLVAYRAVRPIRKISAMAKEISAEDLHRRLPAPKAKDEIHQLTEVLNDTFSRLEKSYSQAMQFASDASHQLKTPITVMRAAIEDIIHDPGLKAEHSAALGDLLQQTRRLSSLAEGLLLLARADAGRLNLKLTEIDLIPVIQGCAEDAEIIAAMQEISIEADLPDTLPAYGDSLRTEQILLNLLENAVKYNRPGGTIRLRAEMDGLGTSITVCNTGQPIPQKHVSRVFDRFSRGEANETRAGHGLGLALARELARAQGGDLSLLRSDAHWTEFELRLRAPMRVGKSESLPLVAAE